MASCVKQRFFGLCLPPILFAALDYSLTLFGQPVEYWSGHYNQTNEASPFLDYLLRIHPLAYVAGCLFLLFCLVVFLLLLSDTLALIACLVGSFSNVIGASTWILHRPHGYQLLAVFTIISGLILASCLRWGWKAGPEGEYRLGIAFKWRFIFAGLLFAIAMYLEFCPHIP